jgi:ABC-type transport system involved in multi-copper enzyme maturation permease subunit
MRTLWHSLIWKEWHEHKWIVSALLVLECGALVPARYQQAPDYFSSFFITLMIIAVPAAVFVGMRTASSERPQQTLPFLLALPISRQKAAAVKLVVGLLTCILPFLSSFVVLWSWYYFWGQYRPGSGEAMQFSLRDVQGFAGSDNWFVVAGLMVTSVTISLYLWTVAVAANRPDEVSAGAWALAAMAIVWTIAVCAAAAVQWLTNGALTKNYSWIVSTLAAMLPCGFTSTHLQDYGPAVARMIAGTFFISHALLAVSFVRRFGRSPTTEVPSPKPAALQHPQQAYLTAPFRSQLAATVWKQFRESGPIALVAANAALAIALVIAVGNFASTAHLLRFFEVFGVTWFVASLYLGGIATLVIGIGVFLRDLEPGLNSFWRSRPIPSDRWFWTRFVSGLAVILLTILLPVLVVSFGAIARNTSAEDIRQGATMFGIAVPIFVATYAVAAAATCLLRRAMFAALVTLAATYFGALAVVAAYVVVRCFTTHQWTLYRFDSVGTPVWIVGLVFDMLFGTLLAWLAVRHDWGRKN